MESFIVLEPCIVNDIPRVRGDVLTGDDAKAVSESHGLKARCIAQPTEPEVKPAPKSPRNPAPEVKE